MLFTISNEAYDTWKRVAQYYLPAIATFYITVAGLWNLPYPKEIAGSIMAIDTLLGVFLGISTAQYNKALLAGPNGE